MEMQGFPNCCTARVIYDFGGTHVSGMNRMPTSENDLRLWIQQRLGWLSRGTLLVAITNSDQKVANKVLRELDFSYSKWMAKNQHQGTKMRLWWKQA